jgi:hypothetical protein
MIVARRESKPVAGHPISGGVTLTFRAKNEKL